MASVVVHDGDHILLGDHLHGWLSSHLAITTDSWSMGSLMDGFEDEAGGIPLAVLDEAAVGKDRGEVVRENAAVEGKLVALVRRRSSQPHPLLPSSPSSVPTVAAVEAWRGRARLPALQIPLDVDLDLDLNLNKLESMPMLMPMRRRRGGLSLSLSLRGSSVAAAACKVSKENAA